MPQGASAAWPGRATEAGCSVFPAGALSSGLPQCTPERQGRSASRRAPAPRPSTHSSLRCSLSGKTHTMEKLPSAFSRRQLRAVLTFLLPSSCPCCPCTGRLSPVRPTPRPHEVGAPLCRAAACPPRSRCPLRGCSWARILSLRPRPRGPPTPQPAAGKSQPRVGWSHPRLRRSAEGHRPVPTSRASGRPPAALDVGVERRLDTLLSLLSGKRPEVKLPYHREVLFSAF